MHDNLSFNITKEGTEKDFEIIFQNYRLLVYRIAFSYTADSFEAENITQDVFVKVYYKLGSFQGKSKFSTWIYRITINTCHDYARRKKMINIEFTDDIDRYSVASDKLYNEKEIQEEVQKAIKRLPEKLRGMVILRYIEQLSCKEIASIFNCSVSSVDVNLFRARKLLKNFLTHLI